MRSYSSKNPRRQTQLAFTPLPSSSPASATYDQRFPDRAAAVTYEGSASPAKRRKIGESMPSDINNVGSISAAEKALPTPKRSSQTRNEDLPNKTYDDESMALTDSDSESTVTRTRKTTSSGWVSRAKKSRIKTQRMLDFGVMATQSPNTQMPSSPPRPQKMPLSRKLRKAHANSEASSNTGKVGFGRRLRSGFFGSDSAVPPNGSDESDITSETLSSSSSRSGMDRRRRPERNSQTPAIHESETVADSSSKRHRDILAEEPKLRRKSSLLLESLLSPRQTRSRAKKASQRASKLPETSKKVLAEAGKQNTTLILLSSGEEESEDMPTTIGSRQQRLRKPARNKRRREIDEVDDDDLVVMHTRKLRRTADVSDVAREKSDNDRQSPADESNEDGSDDDDLPRTPRRRPSHQVLGRRQTQQELEDLQDDLEFLGSANPDAKRSRRRTGDTPQQSARQKALDALKRRRAGRKDDNDYVEETAPSSSKRRALYDTESEGENCSNPEGDSDNGVVTEPSEYEVTTREMFHADKDDEGFIASDDEGALGAPVDLPLEFSHLRHMKTKELFMFAVEWMVQKKINPAFAISDEVYDLAFRRLDDEVRGLAGSKFTSSAWTPEFTRALQARPDIEYHPIGLALLPDKCDACNRSGHPATWEIKFGGMPYRLETLEDVSDNEPDSDDGEDGSMEVYDAKGNVVPDTNITFYVGKFCKQNALTAHALAHWRYHLNSWVVDYLKGAGYCSPEKILERDDWSTKRRREYANKIVDKMEKRGEIASLWRDFKNETNRARNVGVSYVNQDGTGPRPEPYD